MNAKKPTDCLLWDFDGVIADSIDECLITSYNAFLTHQNISEKFIERIKDIPKKVKDKFYKTRQFVRGPREYFVLHKAIIDNKLLNGYGSFKKLLFDFSNIITNYEDIFFLKRRELKKKNPQYWLNLHRVYPWVKDKWNELRSYFDFYIVSNKDTHSISLIMEHSFMFIKKNNIFGKDFSLDKREIIRHILSKEKLRKENTAFIDDNYYNLKGLNKLGIRLFFATWGYGKITNSTICKKITILNPKNFDRKLIRSYD